MCMPRGKSGHEETGQYLTDNNLRERLDLHRCFSINPTGWQRWVFDRLDLPGDARILELGCGPGTLWLENRDRLSPGWRLTLSDASPGMLAAARERLGDVAPGFSIDLIDAVAIPYGDGTFDAVIANHMLYHVDDRPAALAEIRRVLRPGGRLYAATNGQRHMWELDELIQRQVPDITVANAAACFSLENGRTHLEPWFDRVDREDYVDGLEISEAQPVVDYVRSMSEMENITGAQQDGLYRAVTEAIDRNGVYRVSKSAGLFRGVARA